MECQVNTKVNVKVKVKVNTKWNAKVHTKVNVKVYVKVIPKVNVTVNVKVNPKVNTKVNTKVKANVKLLAVSYRKFTIVYTFPSSNLTFCKTNIDFRGSNPNTETPLQSLQSTDFKTLYASLFACKLTVSYAVMHTPTPYRKQTSRRYTGEVKIRVGWVGGK